MAVIKRKKSGRFPQDTPIWLLQVSLLGCLFLWLGLLFMPFGSHDVALKGNVERKQAPLAKDSLLRGQLAPQQQLDKAASNVVDVPENKVQDGEGENDDDNNNKKEEDDDEEKPDNNNNNNNSEDAGEGEEDEERDEENKERDAGKKEDEDDEEENGDAEKEQDGNEEGAEEDEDEEKGNEEDVGEGDGGDVENEGNEEEENRRRLSEHGDGEIKRHHKQQQQQPRGNPPNGLKEKKVDFQENGENELDSKRFVMEITGLTGPSAPPTGKVILETRPAWAPIGAAHFHDLVAAGFYNTCRFFRVVPDFIVQFGIAGSPNVQKEWEKEVLRDDAVVKSNDRGTVTYATAGTDTRTTQLFVNLKSNHFLDSQGFAPFAEIVQGMEFIDAINEEYGERPNQASIERQGNSYLDSNFPNLSYIVTMYEDEGWRAQ